MSTDTRTHEEIVFAIRKSERAEGSRDMLVLNCVIIVYEIVWTIFRRGLPASGPFAMFYYCTPIVFISSIWLAIRQDPIGYWLWAWDHGMRVRMFWLVQAIAAAFLLISVAWVP